MPLPRRLLAATLCSTSAASTFLRDFGSRHGIRVQLGEVDPSRFGRHSPYRESLNASCRWEVRVGSSILAPSSFRVVPDLKWQRIWSYCKVCPKKPIPVTSRASTFSGASRSFMRCERGNLKYRRRSVGVEHSRPFSGILASARRWFQKAFALELAKMRYCNVGNRPTVPVMQRPLLTTVIRKRDRVVECPGYLDWRNVPNRRKAISLVGKLCPVTAPEAPAWFRRSRVVRMLGRLARP